MAGFCSKCGKALMDDEVFCANCGNKVVQQGEAPVGQPMQQTAQPVQQQAPVAPNNVDMMADKVQAQASEFKAMANQHYQNMKSGNATEQDHAIVKNASLIGSGLLVAGALLPWASVFGKSRSVLDFAMIAGLFMIFCAWFAGSQAMNSKYENCLLVGASVILDLLLIGIYCLMLKSDFLGSLGLALVNFGFGFYAFCAAGLLLTYAGLASRMEKLQAQVSMVASLQIWFKEKTAIGSVTLMNIVWVALMSGILFALVDIGRK